MLLFFWVFLTAIMLIFIICHLYSQLKMPFPIVTRQMIQALNYLHANKIIHRDIKLGNVLLKQDLFVKLIDFGLAKEYNPSDKPTICGTPNYLAPEVLTHKGHREVSDMWSVGCVLVVLLSGYAPFEGETTEETYDMIINSPPKLPEHMELYVTDFLMDCLEKNHETRKNGHQLLKHPYIQEFINSPAIRNPDNRDKLISAEKYCKIHENCAGKELISCIKTIPSIETPLILKNHGLSENPKDFVWIQCWIDYTNRDCGFAYRISNDTIGVKLKLEKISYIVKRNIERATGLAKYEYYSESRNKMVEFKDSYTDNRTDDKFRKHVDEMKALADYYDEYMAQWCGFWDIHVFFSLNLVSFQKNKICENFFSIT